MAHGAQGQQHVPAVGARNMHHAGHGVHILAGVQLQRLAQAQAAVAQQQEQQMQPGTRHLALGRAGLGFPLLPAAGKGFQFFSGQMGHCGGSLYGLNVSRRLRKAYDISRLLSRFRQNQE